MESRHAGDRHRHGRSGSDARLGIRGQPMPVRPETESMCRHIASSTEVAGAVHSTSATAGTDSRASWSTSGAGLRVGLRLCQGRDRVARRHQCDDALQVVDGRELHDDPALRPAEVDLDPGLEPSDSRSARTVELRCHRLRARGRGRAAGVLAADRDDLLDAAHREPLGHDPLGQPLLGGRVVEAEQRRGRGRRRAPRPRPGAAPTAAAAAAGGCSRSAGGSGRCARRARRACSRSRAAAGRRRRPPPAG